MTYEAFHKIRDDQEQKKRSIKPTAKLSSARVPMPKVSAQHAELLNPEIVLDPDELKTFLEVLPPPIPAAKKEMEIPPIPAEAKKTITEKPAAKDQILEQYRRYVRQRQEAHQQLDKRFNCPLLPERSSFRGEGFVAVDDQRVMQLEYSGFTMEKKPDAGHQFNQDCALSDPRSRIVAVFDGAGGAKNSERASRLTAEVFHNQFKDEKFQYFESAEEFDAFRADYEKRVRAALLEANRQILSKAKESATTIAFSQVVGASDGKIKLAVATVGDSPIYVMSGRTGKITKINEDHNLLTQLKNIPQEFHNKIAMDLAARNSSVAAVRQKVGDAGFVDLMDKLIGAESAAQVYGSGLEKKYPELTRDEVMTVFLALNNRITRAVGDPKLTKEQVDINWVELADGDSILAASDAVFDNATVAQLERILKGDINNLDKLNAQLLKAFVNKGLYEKGLVKPDDLTECALKVSLAK
ncbi:MAG: PP2C family protein-serine/threonine phosphatase [Patescibacteria group bacterium]